MILIQGTGVSKGIADGPLYFLQKPDTTIVKETGKDVEAEKARIAEAKEKSAAQLMELAEKCREEAGDDAAFVFETHAMFLDDDDYVEGINDCLESEQCNAEYAVRTAGDTFAAMFAAMDDAYMSARAADIKDITQRLLNNLMGVVEGGIDSDVPVILCADDLAPSETLQLDKSKILGFALQGGSGTSHTAILARTMGIPAICGLGDALTDEYNGRSGWIDAETGQIVLDPDEITLKGLEMKAKKQAELKELMQTMIGSPLTARRSSCTATSAPPRTSPPSRPTTAVASASSVPSSCTSPPTIIRPKTRSSKPTRPWPRPWKASASSSGRSTSAPTSRSTTSTCRRKRTRPSVFAPSASASTVRKSSGPSFALCTVHPLTVRSPSCSR